MNLKGVEIGQKVEITMIRKNGENTFESSIADFGNGIVLLMPPVSKGVRQKIYPNFNYEIAITTKHGIFKVKADFVGEKKEQNGSFPAFRLHGEKTKIQRRNHCRLTKILGARMSADHSDDEQGDKQGDKQEDNIFDVTILDLSAGGLRISSKKELDEDSMYDIHFTLPDDRGTQVKCKGAIVWHSWDEEQKVHQYGIQFQVISTGTQDRIFQFIFMQQAMGISS